MPQYGDFRLVDSLAGTGIVDGSFGEVLPRPGRQLGLGDERLSSGRRGAGRRGRAPLGRGVRPAVGRVRAEEDEAAVRVRELRHELAEEVRHLVRVRVRG
jgi:hypothetical protein